MSTPSPPLPSLVIVLHKARQIKEAANRLSSGAEWEKAKETAALIRDLAQALEDLTQIVDNLERNQ